MNVSSNTIMINSIPTSNLIGLIVLVIVVGLLVYAAISLEKYQKIFSVIRVIVSMLRFAAYGSIVSGIAYAIYLMGTLIGSSVGAVDPILFVYGIGILIFLTIVGYVSEIVAKRILKNYQDDKQTEGIIEGKNHETSGGMNP